MIQSSIQQQLKYETLCEVLSKHDNSRTHLNIMFKCWTKMKNVECFRGKNEHLVNIPSKCGTKWKNYIFQSSPYGAEREKKKRDKIQRCKSCQIETMCFFKGIFVCKPNSLSSVNDVEKVAIILRKILAKSGYKPFMKFNHASENQIYLNLAFFYFYFSLTLATENFQNHFHFRFFSF